MTDLSEAPFKPRLVDPLWSLPGEVDSFRTSDDGMFHAMLETAREALERGRVDAPDESYVDARSELEIVKRSVGQALNYHLSPFATAECRAEQLEHIRDTVEDLLIVSAELLHSPDPPEVTLADERRKLELVAPLVETVCIAVELSALFHDPPEALVSKIIDLAWAACAVSGDCKLRERAEGAAPGLRLASLDLCELAEPVARRLKALLAAMLAKRQSRAVSRLATV